MRERSKKKRREKKRKKKGREEAGGRGGRGEKNHAKRAQAEAEERTQMLRNQMLAQMQQRRQEEMQRQMEIQREEQEQRDREEEEERRQENVDNDDNDDDDDEEENDPLKALRDRLKKFVSNFNEMQRRQYSTSDGSEDSPTTSTTEDSGLHDSRTALHPMTIYHKRTMSPRMKLRTQKPLWESWKIMMNDVIYLYLVYFSIIV